MIKLVFMEGRTRGIWLAYLCLTIIVAAKSEAEDTDQPLDAPRSFTIDYKNNQFLKDGQPFRYVSGSIHYFRVLAKNWRDRLWKLRMAGFNAVQTVVEWSFHEPEPGQYRFSGDQDLEQYIRTAQEEDLLVILRVGPYICAERDMGGFPYWLLKLNPQIRLRTSDPVFLKQVDTWLSVLLPRVRPLLYENGGPIISVQVENEYGGGPCDYEYTAHLRDQFRKYLGPSVVLFTVDSSGAHNLRCGKIPEVYATVDFGLDADPKYMFEQQRLFEPQGPLVNSEFYPGWIDHWGEPHHKTDPKLLANGLDAILALNASVNMYVFHGGTSFGFTAGSNYAPKFQSCPTSYDYDAPVSEAGDPTVKYPLLREVIGKYLPLPSGPVPVASDKGVYGAVQMMVEGGIMSLASLQPSVSAPWPLTFEQLGVPSGIVVYSTSTPYRSPDPIRLSVPGVSDRAYVLVDRKLVGVIAREGDLFTLPISARPNATLDLVVESQGRISVGPHLKDFKGLTTNVTLGHHTLKNWEMTSLPLTNTKVLRSSLSRLPQLLPQASMSLGTPAGGLAIYSGSFDVPDVDPHPLDSFLKLNGWTKGIAWVNDFCLGRYWPGMGPQVTLYVPGAVLRRGLNEILLLELEAAPCNTLHTCKVVLQDKHQVDGPTPF